MKTNLGYTIKRKSNFKDGEFLSLPMKCYSCAIQSNGGWCADKWWVSEESCDGFIRAVAEKAVIVECDGYKEQVFHIPKKLKEQLRDWIDEYCYQTLEGKHNITEQSDNWFNMELDLFAGLLYALQHRKAFNDIKKAGQKYLSTFQCKDMDEVYKKLLEETKDENDRKLSTK